MNGANPSATSFEPQPVEIPFAGKFVRGQRWPDGGDWAVLLHEPGGDLDAWGRVPTALAAEGYAVLAVDLPGHGLSDDPWEPARAVELVHALAAFAEGEGAVSVFVISARELATAAAVARNVDALVALSPPPFPIEGPEATPPALVLVGGSDDAAAERANRFFRQTRGWAVMSSFGTEAQGTAIFASDWGEHALEQTLGFLRDYRTCPRG